MVAGFSYWRTSNSENWRNFSNASYIDNYNALDEDLSSLYILYTIRGTIHNLTVVFTPIMTSGNYDASSFSAQARIAELERRLEDSENIRTEQRDSLKKMEEVQKSAMSHFGRQLKDTDEKLEQEQSARMGLELEIRFLNDKVAKLQESSVATGTYSQCDEVAFAAPATPAADSLLAPNDEPRRKRIKLNNS